MIQPQSFPYFSPNSHHLAILNIQISCMLKLKAIKFILVIKFAAINDNSTCLNSFHEFLCDILLDFFKIKLMNLDYLLNMLFNEGFGNLFEMLA